MGIRESFKRIVQILICSTCLFMHTGVVLSAGSEFDQQAQKQVKNKKVHGEGKKQTNCDLKNISVWHDGQEKRVKVVDLITLPAKGNVEPSARRILKRGKLVFPVAHFITEYPGTNVITFETCGSDNDFKLTKDMLEKNTKAYMLTFNRVGRARLAKFEKGGNRGRYNTVAKNIVSIRLTQ